MWAFLLTLLVPQAVTAAASSVAHVPEHAAVLPVLSELKQVALMPEIAVGQPRWQSNKIAIQLTLRANSLLF